jgi:hypothetical protein
MRIYLPATLPMLRQAVETGSFRPVGGLGFAATRGLAAEYPGADTEDLEYLAMHDAALASLRLIAAGGADPVRVVLAVDDDAAESGGVARVSAADRRRCRPFKPGRIGRRRTPGRRAG